MTDVQFYRGGLLAAALFLLAGCSGVKDTVSGFSESVAPTCPAISILPDATRLTRFREGSLGDLTDVQFESEIREIEASCTWKEGAVMVSLELELVTARGPAYLAAGNTLTYFVGVLDFNGAVLSKEKFETIPDIPPGSNAVSWKESQKQAIVLDPGNNGGDYSVVVGLQLSRSELDYNRRWYGR